jgi:hypothetical protein
MTVLSTEPAGQGTIYVGGVADAVAFDGGKNVDVVVDWKTDVEPTAEGVNLYREQVRDYLAATGGKNGLGTIIGTGVKRIADRAQTIRRFAEDRRGVGAVAPKSQGCGKLGTRERGLE